MQLPSVSPTDVVRRFHVYLLDVRQAFSFLKNEKKEKNEAPHESSVFYLRVVNGVRE